MSKVVRRAHAAARQVITVGAVTAVCAVAAVAVPVGNRAARVASIARPASLGAQAADSSPPPALPGDPPYDVPKSRLDAALDCDPFTHSQHEPVLLVHGTGTTGHEEYDWSWAPLLRSRGFDVCIVTYPDRGLGDQQVSAEYIAYAVQKIHAISGRLVDVAGHSQGASMPRWAIRFWPSVQHDIDDFVPVAGPAHGTSVAAGVGQLGAFFGTLRALGLGLPAAFYQFSPTSLFNRAVNSGDEAPGGISYTSIYSTFYDELVEPAAPVPTAGLDWGQVRLNVRNIAVQQVCPGRFVDHLAIGTVDPVAFALALDAFTHPGPADPARIPASVCNQLVLASPAQLAGFASALTNGTLASGLPNLHLTNSEPPLKPYAAAAIGRP